MADTPIWPVATDAIIADTTDLTDSETCAYIMLMICQWRLNGAGLPNDQGKLQRMSRVEKRKWKQTWANIKPLFMLENDRYFQSRVHKDWIKVMQKIVANRESGAKGGTAKSLNLKKQRLADAIETLGQKPSERGSEKLPIHEPLTINHKPLTKKKEKKISCQAATASDDILEAFDYYNLIAEKFGLTKAIKFSDDRKRLLRARLDEYGLDTWKKAMDKVGSCPHLMGHNDRNWKADLPFFLKKSKFLKHLEGSYEQSNNNTADHERDRRRKAIAAALVN